MQYYVNIVFPYIQYYSVFYEILKKFNNAITIVLKNNFL